VPSLAEQVDAVVGIDTHRDTHEAEIADATGAAIATIKISNDSAGFATLLAWVAEHAPGSRIAISIEGTRSYGVGRPRLGDARARVPAAQPPAAARQGQVRPD